MDPQPTKPRFPLAMYGAERRFPACNGSTTESPGQTEIDLYAFAGGYGSRHVGCNDTDEQMLTATIQATPAGTRADETDDSSREAVFSPPSD